MGKGDKKNRKRKKTVGVKDLPPKAKGGAVVKGGRKAGKDQQDYLVVKFNDLLVTS